MIEAVWSTGLPDFNRFSPDFVFSASLCCKIESLQSMNQVMIGLLPRIARSTDEIVDSVTHADGKPFFVDSPELAGAAENKVSRPLYAAVVRIMLRAGDFDRILQLARDLAGSLRVFAHPNGN